MKRFHYTDHLTAYTRVRSSALKYLVPVPNFEGVQCLHIWNDKDKCYQQVKSDGTGVVIINQPTREQAKKINVLAAKHSTANIDNLYSLLADVIHMGLGDQYDSTATSMAKKLIPVEGIPGLYQKNTAITFDVAYLNEAFEILGRTATSQRAEKGGIVLWDEVSKELRVVQTNIFLATFENMDGTAIESVEQIAPFQGVE